MRSFCALLAHATAFIYISCVSSSAASSSSALIIGYARDWLKQSGQKSMIDNFSFHAFNDTSGLCIAHFRPKGFVIIAQNRAFFSIVGYSFENNFSEQKANPISKKLLSPVTISRQDKSLAKKTADSATSLTTALFDQDEGWNALCPPDDSAANGKTIIGCTGVAIAIVMHYWKYPFRGRGILTYAHPKYGALSADLHSVRYAWDKMSATTPDSFNTKLLYHAALALKTEFGPRSSGVSFFENTPYVMMKYFGYDISMRSLCKDNFSESEWAAMIKEQLKQGIPIIYRGTSIEGNGHQFVVDGYNSSGFFHINWGWGGNGNGYYQMNNFVHSTYNYKKSQIAIFSIKPSKILPPSSLVGKRTNQTIEISWKPPQEDVMLAYFELCYPSHIFHSYDFPRRISGFSCSSFGLAAPLSLTAIGHSFYSITPDSLFSFAVYDTDKTTVLGSSPEIKANMSYMEYRFTTPITVSDSFIVGVIPSNPIGNLSSYLSEVEPSSSRSMYGQPGMWYSFFNDQSSGELHTYVFARGCYLPGKSPEGGFLIERNGAIIDTLHSLEKCIYQDSSFHSTPPRYRVIAFRDTTAYTSLPSDSIIVSSTSCKPIRTLACPNAFYLEGNKCIVKIGSDDFISLEIFSSVGQKIQTLHKGHCKAGIRRFAIPDKIGSGCYVLSFRSSRSLVNKTFIAQKHGEF